MNKKQLVTDVLKEVLQSHPQDNITFGDIMDVLSERGFAILLMLFAAPMALPLPAIPGVTAILALPLFIFSIQMMFQMKKPWLPTWLKKKTIHKSTIEKWIGSLEPILHKLNILLRPRMVYITGRIGERLIGMAGFFFSCSIALPIPLSNTVPSIAIEIMALGLIMRDGLWVKVGIIIGFAWITLLLFFGSKALALFF